MNADYPREACGIVGVFGVPDAAGRIFTGLFALQHRGQEAAGIVVADGTQVKSAKGIGLVSDVFSQETLRGLVGHLGIGHVRYSTTGSPRIQNVQPLVVADVVRGKRVVVVDDSIIRGTTSRRRVCALREAGAKEIHLRISCPPTMHPCFFGIDFATKEELIASSRSIDEICRYTGADSLGYLSIEGLLSPFPDASHYCTACFSGNYPVDVSRMKGKEALESLTPLLNLETKKR
jgi:glutamine phosphoribosylpyrophosphate amidotransferase